ncbi:MAG TPA: hypothetical protein VIF32_08150 [Gemmatimonadaceae bacterium]
MTTTDRRVWIRAVLLAGAAYVVIGRVFAYPTTHAQFWRWAAWVVSGVVFAAQIGYEHFRLRYSPRTTALHAALASAIGGFGLAVAASVHKLMVSSALEAKWLIAFVAWPAITFVPAFVVAFAVAAVLARINRVS